MLQTLTSYSFEITLLIRINKLLRHKLVISQKEKEHLMPKMNIDTLIEALKKHI